MEYNPHYFFAVQLPDELKENVRLIASDLQRVFPFKSWVHPLDLHITLAFLGSAEPSQLEFAKQSVNECLSNVVPFSLEINRIGVFGQKDSPRIFWLGLEQSESLAHIRNQIYSVCIAAGFKLDSRPFSPHITLARKWAGDEVFESGKLHSLNPFKEKNKRFTAEKIVLYKSHIGKTPKYEAITKFSLSALLNE